VKFDVVLLEYNEETWVRCVFGFARLRVEEEKQQVTRREVVR
jgi:hypothetical protein